MRITLRQIAVLFAAAFLFAALLFNQSAVHWRADVNDSHYFAYCGWRIAHGAVPYLDVWDNKPPGAWWFNALAYRLFETDPWGEILICSAALLLTLLGFIAVARCIYHPSIWPVALLLASVLLTHIFYQCGANRTETFVAAAETLAVLGYLRWRRGGAWSWLALAGLSAGVAPLCKQAGIAALAAGAFHLAWSQFRASRRPRPSRKPQLWKPWLVGGIAFLTPLLIAAVTLAAQGALSDAYFAVWSFNRAYFDVNDATWWNLANAVKPYLEVTAPLYGVAILVAGAAILSLVWRQPATPDNDRSGLGVIPLWLLFSAYFACVGPGRQPYHLGPVLVPFGLVAIYPIYRLMNGRPLARRMVGRPSLAVALVAYLYISMSLGADSFARARGCWQTRKTWWSLTRDPPADYEIQAAELRRLTNPSDRIYVWGWSTGTYRYAYRHCVSRYATLEKINHVGPCAEFIYRGAVADLHRDPPAALAISTGDLEALLSQPQGDMTQLIRGRYLDQGNFAGMHILVRTPFTTPHEE